jgi:hypothetical protein
LQHIVDGCNQGNIQSISIPQSGEIGKVVNEFGHSRGVPGEPFPKHPSLRLRLLPKMVADPDRQD